MRRPVVAPLFRAIVAMAMVAAVLGFESGAGFESGTSSASAGFSSAQAASTAEFVTVGMPFDGAWANQYGTHPGVHSRRSDQDWTMDIFAPDASVHFEVTAASGAVAAVVNRVELDTTCGSAAGRYVLLDLSVDGVAVGTVLFHHLVDLQVVEGESLLPGALLGSTVASPEALGGNCWRVTTPFGIHTHFAVANSTGSSCYIAYEIGAFLTAGTAIAQLGFDPDGSVGHGPRWECGSELVPLPTCKNRVATIVGTEGPDVLTGTAGDDVIVALGGDDRVVALGGNDIVCGGDGNDQIDGGDGHDFLRGGAGDDVLRGGADHDKLLGGDGNDLLQGNRGTDWLAGQNGDDDLRGAGGPDHLRGHAGNDTLSGGAGADRLWGDDGDDVIRGGRGPDAVGGGAGFDLCDGGPNNNDTADRFCERSIAVP